MSVRHILVRHGRPTAGYGREPDPGLDPVGVAQAEAIADALSSLGPRPVLSSPLRRTRETAAPLAATWGSEVTVVPALGEIQIPEALVGQADRVMVLARSRWDEVDPVVRRWRDELVDAVRSWPEDSVAATHFFAINAVVSFATDDDRLVGFTPDHCSRTVVEVEGNRIRLVERGEVATTSIV
jgi:broad specificity phosphatase PhoE